MTLWLVDILIQPQEIKVNEGDTATYSVTLSRIPKGEVWVIVNLDQSDTQLFVQPSILRFSPHTQIITQKVHVSVLEDNIQRFHHSKILFHQVISKDVEPTKILHEKSNVTVIIQDNDSAGITLSRSSLNIYKEGKTDSYTIVLESQPTADVIVSLEHKCHTLDHAHNQLKVKPKTLLFHPKLWHVPQRIVVEGVENGVSNCEFEFCPPQAHIITHTVMSEDPLYNSRAESTQSIPFSHCSSKSHGNHIHHKLANYNKIVVLVQDTPKSMKKLQPNSTQTFNRAKIDEDNVYPPAIGNVSEMDIHDEL